MLVALLSGAVYTMSSAGGSDGDAATPKLGTNFHMLTGTILGVLLVARLALGVQRVEAASTQVQSFNKACRSLAVMSSMVTETITISAGAEQEKNAVDHFRRELVRLLNLGFYCYQLSLKGLKLASPPEALRSRHDKSEADMLSSVDNPTVMVGKLIASSIEQQRQAKRISNEQSALFVSGVNELVATYHATLASFLSPLPVSLTSFTYVFTLLWVYTAGPVIAMNEIGRNGVEPVALVLSLCFSFLLGIFFTGLYEAGKILEAPIHTAVTLLAIDEIGWSLSNGLSALVGDGDIPVFMPAPE